MKSEYTTVLDAGTAALPALPLILMLATPVLILACTHVAKARSWHVSRPLKISLWACYIAYAPAVLFQYWSLWQDQNSAQNATSMSVEAGRLDAPAVYRAPDGLFVEISQDFAVNGVAFQYTHRTLRVLSFLLPQSELVALPLRDHAHVRVTYRGDGGDRRLLRFEIATSDLDAAHD
ncbi:MAG TPA: hypothetical protein VFG64_09550 [Dongiaceae bacterium]|nr:hypothetical protein [Dongiaceae bacterium]